MPLILHNGSLLTVNGALANSTGCCCGECDLCSPVPSRMILTMPKLQDWSEYEQQLCIAINTAGGLNPGDPGYCDWEANMNANSCYRCWQQWSNGGCASCNELSESEQTLIQKAEHSSPNCDENGDVICPPFELQGCQNLGKTNCLWNNIIPTCTVPEGFWLEDIEEVTCCGKTWNAFSINPGGWAGNVLCYGYTNNEDCFPGEDTGVPPFYQECNCGSCPDNGVPVCHGGCCYMAWIPFVQITGPSGGGYTVSAGVARYWNYATPLSHGNGVLSASREIDEAEWDCLATEIEFTWDECAITESIINQCVPMCRFDIPDDVAGTDVIFKVRRG